MATDFTINLYQKDNSTLVGALGDDLFYSGVVNLELNGDERLTAEVNQSHADYSSLALSMILQLVHTDENFTKRFRIHSMAEVRNGDATHVEIVALGLKFDLANARHNYHGALIEQSVSTHINQILSGTDFSAGTITPSATFTLEYSFNPVLDDLFRVREKVNESGTEYDIVVNDNLTVDLVIAGNQSSTSTVEFKKNLINLNRTQTRPEANTFFVLGGAANDGAPMTIRNARFLVTEINDLGGSTEIVLDSDEILLSNDSLNGFKVEAIDPEEATLISDSYKQGGGFDAVVVGGSPDGTFQVGDWVRFREPAPSTLIPLNLNFIQDAGSVSSHGEIADVYRNDEFQDVENLARPYETSALSGTYTAGVCEGWAVVGDDVTATENSSADYIENGTKSQKVVVGAFSLTPAAPSVAVVSAAVADLTGSYTYKTCYVTADGCGPLSAASGSVSPAFQAVSVGLNDSGYSGRDEVLGWQVYRKESADADYYLVHHSDDFTATFYDTTPNDVYQQTHPGVTGAPGGQGVSLDFAITAGKRYSCVVNLFVSGPPYGQVRVELDVGNVAPDVGAEQSTLATETITSDQQFIVAIGGVTAKPGAGTLRVLAHQGEAVFYIDSVMIVESDVPPPIDKFVAESAGAGLWKSAYRYAQGKTSVGKEITVEIQNNYPLDSSDEFQLGDSITLVDSAFSINESVRIPSKSFLIREPWDANITLSTKPPQIANLLTSLQKSIETSSKGAAQASSRLLTQSISNGAVQILKVQ